MRKEDSHGDAGVALIIAKNSGLEFEHFGGYLKNEKEDAKYGCLTAEILI